MGVGPKRDEALPPDADARDADADADVDGGEDREQPPPVAPYFTLRLQILAGIIVGVSYLVSFVLRDETLPGIVGGALAGVLTVLLMREIEARRRRRRR